jgi:hypothetical protein
VSIPNIWCVVAQTASLRSRGRSGDMQIAHATCREAIGFTQAHRVGYDTL